MNRHFLNIGLVGGHCTGKTELADLLIGDLKPFGYKRGEDYSNVKIKERWGMTENPFQNFYLLDKIRRLDEASSVPFIQDETPFLSYGSIVVWAKSKKDKILVDDLRENIMPSFKDLYGILIIAKDPYELPYVNTNRRKATREEAIACHYAIEGLIKKYWQEERIIRVNGSIEERRKQVLSRLDFLK